MNNCTLGAARKTAGAPWWWWGRGRAPTTRRLPGPAPTPASRPAQSQAAAGRAKEGEQQQGKGGGGCRLRHRRRRRHRRPKPPLRRGVSCTPPCRPAPLCGPPGEARRQGERTSRRTLVCRLSRVCVPDAMAARLLGSLPTGENGCSGARRGHTSKGAWASQRAPSSMALDTQEKVCWTMRSGRVGEEEEPHAVSFASRQRVFAHLKRRNAACHRRIALAHAFHTAPSCLPRPCSSGGRSPAALHGLWRVPSQPRGPCALRQHACSQRRRPCSSRRPCGGTPRSAAACCRRQRPAAASRASLAPAPAAASRSPAPTAAASWAAWACLSCGRRWQVSGMLRGGPRPGALCIAAFNAPAAVGNDNRHALHTALPACLLPLQATPFSCPPTRPPHATATFWKSWWGWGRTTACRWVHGRWRSIGELLCVGYLPAERRAAQLALAHLGSQLGSAARIGRA